MVSLMLGFAVILVRSARFLDIYLGVDEGARKVMRRKAGENFFILA